MAEMKKQICICYLGESKPTEMQVEAAGDPIVPNWCHNPDPLGCPEHRPTKQYCRMHHAGFYGSCSKCRFDENSELLKNLLFLLQ